MDIRNRLTDDEWNALAAGPAAAAAAMLATSNPGFIGLFKETVAVAKATTHAPQNAEAAELVSALSEYARDNDDASKSFLDGSDDEDRESQRTAGLEGIDRAGLAAKKLTPGEADGYVAWVLGVAQAIAEAAPDQGESVKVSAAEEQTIAEVERRLRRG